MSTGKRLVGKAVVVVILAAGAYVLLPREADDAARSPARGDAMTASDASRRPAVLAPERAAPRASVHPKGESSAPPPAVAAADAPVLDGEAARKALVPLLEERARFLKSLGDAIDEGRAGRWARAAELAHQVVVAQPDNTRAVEIEEFAKSAERGVFAPPEIRAKLEQWRSWIDVERGSSGYADTQLLNWPSASFWEKAVAPRAVWTEAKWKGGDAYVRSVVDSALVSITAENEPLASIAGRLAAATGIDIDLRRLPDGARTKLVAHLDLRERPLSVVLDAITAGTEWAWSVKHRRVEIRERAATGRAASDRLLLLTHPIFGLVEPPRAPTDAPPAQSAPFRSLEALLAAIRAEVDPEYWTSQPGAALAPQGSTALIVKATEGVHEDVAEWLQNHRGRSPAK